MKGSSTLFSNKYSQRRTERRGIKGYAPAMSANVEKSSFKICKYVFYLEKKL